MNFSIKVFGCQYNEFDAVKLSNELKSLGLVETNLDEADFVFVLNCSVRKTGVDRALGFTRNLQNKKVFLSGCVLEKDQGRFLKKGVVFFDIDDLQNLPRLIGAKKKNNKAKKETVSKFIPIMKGCDNFCSYCVVPYTRGRELSRPFEVVLKDVIKVIGAGHKEIWLLGQNVNSYEGVITSQADQSAGERSRRISDDGILASSGSARTPQDDSVVGFAKLLQEINDLDGDFLIYFTSNHPKDMTDEIIEAVATLPKIAKQIHLPLQSGSDQVLRSMNRPYTAKKYLELAKKIKARIPDIKITTDVIVGYPGESEDDFKKTVDIFKEVGFFQAYVNKYSPREGTRAHMLGDPIPWTEKQRRWEILNDIANKK